LKVKIERKNNLIKEIKVNNRSIIHYFDKTPENIVCPHFYELRWAFGCPLIENYKECAWCYLLGTKRGNRRTYYKPRRYIEKGVMTFFRLAKNKGYILNTGELADSLMDEGYERQEPFSIFITRIFKRQNRHKILLLTKLTNVEHFIKSESQKVAIISFSLNSESVAEKWEKHAPSITERIGAARRCHESGYEVRVRIDPIVPYPLKTWHYDYKMLIHKIFDNLTPSRITLGTLRGLQKTRRHSLDKSWIKFLDQKETGWGWKMSLGRRYICYINLINFIRDYDKNTPIALCKEEKKIIYALKDKITMRCNCTW